MPARVSSMIYYKDDRNFRSAYRSHFPYTFCAYVAHASAFRGTVCSDEIFRGETNDFNSRPAFERESA